MYQSRSRISNSIVNLLAAFALTAATFLGWPSSASPAKPGNSCSTSITSCGCVMDKRATYTVMNDLDDGQGLTSAGNCLEVAADHVVLDLVGNAIIGSGSGIGILIRKNADFAVVQGTDLSEPAQAIVNGWNVALEDDANSATIELFRQLGGNLFNQHGNTTSGLILIGASNTTVDDLNASFNGKNGVVVTGGSGNRFMNFDATNNGADGIVFDSSNANTMVNCTLTANTLDGVTMISADSNQVFTASINGNQKIGVLLGCGKSQGASCGSKGSNFNHVSNAGANGNSSPGIVIDKGSSSNSITNFKAAGNGGSFDAVDNNHSCDDNIWFNNTFGTVSQSCIH